MDLEEEIGRGGWSCHWMEINQCVQNHQKKDCLYTLVKNKQQLPSEWVVEQIECLLRNVKWVLTEWVVELI